MNVFLWAAIAVGVAGLALTLAAIVVQERARRQARQIVSDPADPWDGLPVAEPGAQYSAVDERIRATAAADAAEAAFVTPGRPVADAFLAELFPRKERK